MPIQSIHSAALNNISERKVQEKLASIVGACETCSKLDKQEGMNGICSKCRTMITACNRYALGNIGLEYWDLTMEHDWKGDPKLLTKYNELVADLGKTYTNGTSVMFAGGHGRGKTMVMSCILKKAAQKGYSILYTTLGDVVSALTQAEYEEQFVARKALISSDWLAIDEFDPRWWSNEKSADLYGKMLENIIRIRFSNKQPVFLATNSPNAVEALSGSLREALGSLFAGYVETFVVMGNDVRQGNK